MKLRYARRSRKGRIKSYGFIFMQPSWDTEENIWFGTESKKWIKVEMGLNESVSSAQNCRSIRAFRRHLRKMAGGEMLGITFILSSRYIGNYTVFGKVK